MHRYLTVLCAHANHMGICESTTQLIGGVVVAMVHMGIHFSQNSGCVDCNEATEVVVIEVMGVHLAQERA